jgi:hypothetical protein
MYLSADFVLAMTVKKLRGGKVRARAQPVKAEKRGKV